MEQFYCLVKSCPDSITKGGRLFNGGTGLAAHYRVRHGDPAAGRKAIQQQRQVGELLPPDLEVKAHPADFDEAVKELPASLKPNMGNLDIARVLGEHIANLALQLEAVKERVAAAQDEEKRLTLELDRAEAARAAYTAVK